MRLCSCTLSSADARSRVIAAVRMQRQALTCLYQASAFGDSQAEPQQAIRRPASCGTDFCWPPQSASSEARLLSVSRLAVHAAVE